MLPRVAFEYGQTWWAVASRASACAVSSTSGSVTRSSTSSWNRPPSAVPMPTRAVTRDPAVDSRIRRAARDLLVVQLAQGVVGFVQYFTDLPILLVLLHMLGAVVIAAFTARLVWSVRGPATTPSSYRTTPRPGAVPQLH